MAVTIRGLDPGTGTITIDGVPYTMDGAGNLTLPFSAVSALASLGTVRQTVYIENSAERPTVDDGGLVPGFMVFQADPGKPLWWDGEEWVDATGATVA